MFFPDSQVNIWLYGKPTDMRKSFDGLIALAKNHMQCDPLSGHLFAFINRRQTQMKILYFDRSGFCLWSKRLEAGRFQYDPKKGEKQALSVIDLKLILEGIDKHKIIQRKRFKLPDT